MGCPGQPAPSALRPLRAQATDAELSEVAKLFPTVWRELIPHDMQLGGQGHATLDLTVESNRDGAPNWQGLDGTFHVSCTRNCVLRAGMPFGPQLAAGMFGLDFPLPAQLLSSVSLQGLAKGGSLDIIFVGSSPELILHAYIFLKLASSPKDSAISGCARLKPAAASPSDEVWRLASLLGPREDADGYFNISLAGTLAGMRKRAALHCYPSGVAPGTPAED